MKTKGPPPRFRRTDSPRGYKGKAAAALHLADSFGGIKRGDRGWKIKLEKTLYAVLSTVRHRRDAAEKSAGLLPATADALDISADTPMETVVENLLERIAERPADAAALFEAEAWCEMTCGCCGEEVAKFSIAEREFGGAREIEIGKRKPERVAAAGCGRGESDEECVLRTVYMTMPENLIVKRPREGDMPDDLWSGVNSKRYQLRAVVARRRRTGETVVWRKRRAGTSWWRTEISTVVKELAGISAEDAIRRNSGKFVVEYALYVKW